MPWVRIDDGMPQHPKVAAAGPLAFALQIAGLCYCNRNLTDGFIPRAVARTLLDWEYVDPDGRVWVVSVTCGMQGENVQAENVIDQLVDAGISWREKPEGTWTATDATGAEVGYVFRYRPITHYARLRFRNRALGVHRTLAACQAAVVGAWRELARPDTHHQGA